MFISRSSQLLTIWDLLPNMRVINFVLQAIILWIVDIILWYTVNHKKEACI